MRTTPVTAHDRERLRVTWRVLGAGVAVGVVGAAILAMMGLDGRVGFAAVALGSALGCVAAGLTTAIVAIIDEARNAPVATRRIGITLGMFVLGGLLLMMVFALGSSTA